MLDVPQLYSFCVYQQGRSFWVRCVHACVYVCVNSEFSICLRFFFTWMEKTLLFQPDKSQCLLGKRGTRFKANSSWTLIHIVCLGTFISCHSEIIFLSRPYTRYRICEIKSIIKIITINKYIVYLIVMPLALQIGDNSFIQISIQLITNVAIQLWGWSNEYHLMCPSIRHSLHVLEFNN